MSWTLRCCLLLSVICLGCESPFGGDDDYLEVTAYEVEKVTLAAPPVLSSGERWRRDAQKGRAVYRIYDDRVVLHRAKGGIFGDEWMTVNQQFKVFADRTTHPNRDQRDPFLQSHQLFSGPSDWSIKAVGSPGLESVVLLMIGEGYVVTAESNLNTVTISRSVIVDIMDEEEIEKKQ